MDPPTATWQGVRPLSRRLWGGKGGYGEGGITTNVSSIVMCVMCWAPMCTDICGYYAADYPGNPCSNPTCHALGDGLTGPAGLEQSARASALVPFPRWWPLEAPAGLCDGATSVPRMHALPDADQKGRSRAQTGRQRPGDIRELACTLQCMSCSTSIAVAQQ